MSSHPKKKRVMQHWFFCNIFKKRKFKANDTLFTAKNKNKLLKEVSDTGRVLIYKPVSFESRQSEPEMSDKRVSSARK